MTSNLLYLGIISGVVPGKARPRVTRRGTFMPPAYQRWQRSAQAALRSSMSRRAPFLEPLGCRLVVVLPAPKKRPSRGSAHRQLWRAPGGEPFPWIGTRGDADNIAGSVLDALTGAGVIEDDRLVGELMIQLMASHRAEDIGASIALYRLATCPLGRLHRVPAPRRTPHAVGQR